VFFVSFAQSSCFGGATTEKSILYQNVARREIVLID
jgi:hypothetical protein